MKDFAEVRVALVHDWLTGLRGGERVLSDLLELFPDADIYTLVYKRDKLGGMLAKRRVFTSFIQRLPGRDHRYYLPLFPRAIEAFDLSAYDLVVSSSHCVAKGVKRRHGAMHVCYCHTPMRYVWDMYEEYFRPRQRGAFMRLVGGSLRKYLRGWDRRTAVRPDYYIANSQNVKERISKYYQRESTVIYPPLDFAYWRKVKRHVGDYYLVLSALVPYKRVDLAVEAFAGLDRKLVVAGEGPESKKLRASAAENIEFLGRVSDEKRAELFAGARALIFPGEEDFGLTPLEAVASGCPVVAYAAGGALESVREGINGTFFERQDAAELRRAVRRLEKMSFHTVRMRGSVARFDRNRFMMEMKGFIKGVLP